MVRVQRLMLVSFALLAAAFAGCTETPVIQEDGETFDDFELEATEETGVIRGVVVDDTITPVAGATVRLENTEVSTTTNADGAFGIKDLAPGTYFLNVDAVGYQATQTSADVQAGIDNPPVVRVSLTRDQSELPYISPFQFNGHIQCSASTAAYRVALCGVPDIVTDLLGQPSVTTDDFLRGFEADAGADALQAELIWESTQPLGDHLSLSVEHGSLDGQEMNGTQGPSPLVALTNKAMIDASGFGATGYFQERVFNMEYPGTAPPVPVCGVPNPVHGGDMCVKGWGLTLEQPFEIFTHVFYKFNPDAGWQFSVDGPHNPPA